MKVQAKQMQFLTISLLSLIAIFILSTKAYAMNEEDNMRAVAAGANGAKRLNIQDDTLKTGTEKHLHEAGLSEGQTVCDVGCGPGTRLPFLARAVGEFGLVYAVDMSEELLALAKQRVSAEGLKNVRFIHGDIRNPQTQQELPIGEIDLVYMRALLIHVTDPENVISVVKTLLKDGGVVASHESVISTSRAYPDEFFGEYVVLRQNLILG